VNQAARVRRRPRLVRDRASSRSSPLHVGDRCRSTGSWARASGGAPFVIGFSAVFVRWGWRSGWRAPLTDHRIALVHLGGIVIVAMGS
jgi:hypothetical protein